MTYIKQSHKLGIFFGILFAVCFAWFYINPALNELHKELFQLTFLGLDDMNGVGFIIGLVQSYVWAYIAVALWKLAGILSFSRK